MKKFVSMSLAAMLLLGALTGCGSETQNTAGTGSAADDTPASAPALSGAISVISREDGSGTRGAFIELFGIEQKDADGSKADLTTDAAEVTNSTSVMMTTVAGNKNAIGYISLGSLDDSVKSLAIDGAAATVDNIKSGTYKIARPFNIAAKDGLSASAQDFIDFILSADGQAVVTEKGYISVGGAPAYTGSNDGTKITVAGSSSVTPVMEALKEAYLVKNPNAQIEVLQSDSTTGMNSAIEGVCDIGMASREVKDSELAAGLTPTVIAMDGIAVIVNNDSPLEGLTSEQVRAIYTGELTDWSALG